MAMDEVELRSFLSLPLIAEIVTLKNDGSPQITPVWYNFDGTYLYVSTTSDRMKAKNIKRDNRVAVCVRDVDAHRVVLIDGTADILDDKEHASVRRIAARYMPSDKVDGFLDTLEANRVIIRAKPTKWVSWDYSKSGS